MQGLGEVGRLARVISSRPLGARCSQAQPQSSTALSTSPRKQGLDRLLTRDPATLNFLEEPFGVEPPPLAQGPLRHTAWFYTCGI